MIGLEVEVEVARWALHVGIGAARRRNDTPGAAVLHVPLIRGRLSGPALTTISGALDIAPPPRSFIHVPRRLTAIRSQPPSPAIGTPSFTAAPHPAISSNEPKGVSYKSVGA